MTDQEWANEVYRRINEAIGLDAPPNAQVNALVYTLATCISLAPITGDKVDAVLESVVGQLRLAVARAVARG